MLPKQLLVISIIISICVLETLGHGTMVMPNNWFDKKEPVQKDGKWHMEYIGWKSGKQCYPGHDISPKDLCPGRPKGCGIDSPGASCFWFTNYTFIQVPTISDPKLLTYPYVKPNVRFDWTSKHPWRAPGAARIDSPCGVGGGNLHGCAGGCTPGAYNYGKRAEDFNFQYTQKVTKWKRGSVVEAAWGITANHGGGYAYRLCKIPEIGVRGITEKCFQENHLFFATTKQWVQYGEDVSSRIEFNATRTRIGTFPPGSEWTKNPIPACQGSDGGFFSKTRDCPEGTQYKPPTESLFGFGILYSDITTFPKKYKAFQWSIVDKLRVPADIPRGDYVLSFRWDCEQTPQVWNTCAYIRIF